MTCESSAVVNTKEVDVIVVGAGFSGLSAVRLLHQQGQRVAVLEARDRVGGRTMAGRIAGLTVDLGGMWAGPTQTELPRWLTSSASSVLPIRCRAGTSSSWAAA